MTKIGNIITLDVGEARTKWAELLDAVEREGSIVRICRGEAAVAELLPAARRVKLPPEDPELKVKFAPDYNPVEGLREDEWPEELR